MEKIFISYSRENSKFILKLSNSLLDKNISIWLDQINIKPGQTWDEEIQKALSLCHKFLVVLSKRSVISSNVLDEIAYATDNNKVIIPILYEDCTIPFRIIRIQYIDFRGNYDEAFEKLLKTLVFKKFNDNLNIVNSKISPKNRINNTRNSNENYLKNKTESIYLNNNRNILLIGSSGSGKTEFIKSFAKSAKKDYGKTRKIKNYKIKINNGFINFIDTPGIPHILPNCKDINKITKNIDVIINFVCYGTHNCNKRDPLDEKELSEYFEINGKYELGNKNASLINSLHNYLYTRPKYFVTLINKMDLWINFEKKVMDYYLNGDYSKFIKPLYIPIKLKYEVISYATFLDKNCNETKNILDKIKKSKKELSKILSIDLEGGVNYE